MRSSVQIRGSRFGYKMNVREARAGARFVICNVKQPRYSPRLARVELVHQASRDRKIHWPSSQFIFRHSPNPIAHPSSYESWRTGSPKTRPFTSRYGRGKLTTRIFYIDEGCSMNLIIFFLSYNSYCVSIWYRILHKERFCTPCNFFRK